MASAVVVLDDPDVDTRQATARDSGLWRRRAGMSVRPILLGVVLLLLYLWVQAQTLDTIETRTLDPARLRTDLLQHVKLSLVATALTIAIAVPLGVLLTRSFARWIKPIGLVAYATLPILRNTIVGLDGVDPALKEAARGMGMSRLAVLRRVELPLAVPVILAGVRTALVLTVATATLATFIDAGGLGGGLISGIKLNRPTLTLTFGVLAAVLALFADWVGGVAEEVLRPRGI